MNGKKKVMLVGWDAADWKVINELMDAGKMPALQSMVENGVMGNMRTLNPPLSPMLWTSVATGKRPYKHGIYGFTEPAGDGKSIQPITILTRKCKAIWNILNQEDYRSLVVGWWPSHPAEPINGVMVSDYFGKAPKRPGSNWGTPTGCVSPADRLNELTEFRVHPMEIAAEDILPFVPKAAEFDQTTDARLSSVMKITSEASTVHATATWLLENEPWDFAAVYYDAIDHYSHGFMKYRAPKQDFVSDEDFEMFRHVVDTAYMFHDAMLKRLLELAGDDTTVILMSDHGFHPDHLRPAHLPAEPAGPALEHREHGIFVVSGPGIRKDQIVHGANLLDITPTILSILNLPIGADMDGRPLLEIFETEPKVQETESWEMIEGNDGRHPVGTSLPASDAKEALQQLVALGYIDPPDEDGGKAVADCQRELDYNLARSHMDAGMFGEAIPLLLKLYIDNPLEFRFGMQLASCLRVMGRNEDLGKLVADLKSRWAVARRIARERFRDVIKVARERKENWLSLKELDDANQDTDLPRLARVNSKGKPILFEENEQHGIRKLRAIIRGNAQSLEYLSATVAMSQGAFEEALAILDDAKIADSGNPSMLYQLGNVYLELDQPDNAVESFKKGLEYDPNHANCSLGLCRAFLIQGDIDRAVEFGKKATGLLYHFPVAHYFLGQALLASRQVDAAIQSVKTAIDQNPNFPEARDVLAEIYSRKEGMDDVVKTHRSLAESLREENQDAARQHDDFVLPDLDSQDLARHLPEHFSKSDSKEFVPCLAEHIRSDLKVDGQSEGVPEVVVVSGLPRSGTSMMMQMLKAGGMTLFTDNVRQADESNPKGYFEVEAVKSLGNSNSWIPDCDGQVLKVVAPLIPSLPQGVRYKVIFMRRDLDAVIGSQADMLDRLGERRESLDSDRLASVFRQQAYFAVSLLTLHQHPVLRLAYDEVVEKPQEVAERICAFFGQDLDVDAMVRAVDPSLRRQQAEKSPG